MLLPVTAAMAAVPLGVTIDGTRRLLMLFARLDPSTNGPAKYHDRHNF